MTLETTTPPCPQCGRDHRGLVAVLGPSAPLPWLTASDAEREAGILTTDMCAFEHDGATRYFLRGHLEIAVTDGPPPLFAWSVWVSLEEADMGQISDHWENPDRARVVAPMVGRLSSELLYPETTMQLTATVHPRDPGTVPAVELDPTSSHPLAVHQRTGITRHEVSEFNDLLLPPA